MNGVSLEIPVADENQREEIEKIYVNRRISAAVDANFRPGTFRSSVVLKDALKAIVESHVVPHLRQCYGQASFNTRVGALMKLSVSFLCMPRLSTLLGFGLMPSENEGYEITKSLKACVTEMLSILLDSERFKLNAASDASLDKRRIKLLVDLVLLRRSLLIPFVITMTENCPEALAHMSCNVLVVSALADEIHDTIKIVTKKVRNLLNKDLSLTTSSTREILKSEFSKYFVWLRLHQDGLIKICRNNEIFCSVDKSVKAWLKGEEYESPTQIVDRYNQKYRKYLTNMNIPLQAFRIEDIRQAVKDIKRDTIMLNNVRYCSHEGISLRTKSKTINGIIENQKNDSQYSYETNISGKASDNDLHQSNCTINSTDKTQEKKIQSNSHNNLEDEGSENVFLVHAVVQKLYDSLPEECHQNMIFHVISNVDHSFSVKHVLSDEDKDEHSGENKEKEKVDITDNFHNNVCESLNEQSHDEDVSSLEFEKLIVEECIGDIPSISTFSYLEVEHVSADSFEMISAGDVNSVFQNSELGSRIRAYSCNCSASKSGCESPRSDTSMCSTVRTNEIPRSTYNNDIDNSAAKLHEIVLEMLLNQVLLAASRTTAGGDAYIMLENLYGGEGLLFSPRSYKMEQRRLSIVEDPREQNVIMPSSGHNRERERDDFNSYPLDDRYIDGGDDSTHINQSSSLEKCRKREKSYSGIEIAISSSGVRVVLKEQYNLLLKESLEQNMELSLPLISFECTTTTHINYPHTNYCTSDLYQKLLYNTENICRRNITIEPIIFR